MKILLLSLTLLLGMVMTASAQISESVTLKAGQQKTASKSQLKIKFISVIEDSRCPVGVDCVWEGNAKIRVEVCSEHQTKTFEFNTTIGPRGDILDGWSIRVVELTPVPQEGKKIDPKTYSAKFDIARLTR